MPLPGPLLERLQEDLARHTGRATAIEAVVPVDGGSINDPYRLDTDAGPFFVKVDTASRHAAGQHPGVFEAEADGLRRLGATGTVRVPQVITFGEDHDVSYLLLEHIGPGLKTPAFWEAFGRSLARLHTHTGPSFGLDRDNYIGSLRQINTPRSTWSEFYIACRLEPQVKLARDRNRLGAGDALRFERFYALLPTLFPTEPPTLLHGDLWSGNFLCDASGQPVLIDPAVYHGHREMDIAMTKLFGGFNKAFYAAYTNERPLAIGWQERVDLCNMYPLLVHTNLFGGGYAAQVGAILRMFV